MTVLNFIQHYIYISHSSLSLSMQKTEVFVWPPIPWTDSLLHITAMLKTVWEILKLVKYTLPLYETIL